MVRNELHRGDCQYIVEVAANITSHGLVIQALEPPSKPGRYYKRKLDPGLPSQLSYHENKEINRLY